MTDDMYDLIIVSKKSIIFQTCIYIYYNNRHGTFPSQQNSFLLKVLVMGDFVPEMIYQVNILGEEKFILKGEEKGTRRSAFCSLEFGLERKKKPKWMMITMMGQQYIYMDIIYLTNYINSNSRYFTESKGQGSRFITFFSRKVSISSNDSYFTNSLYHFFGWVCL